MVGDLQRRLGRNLRRLRTERALSQEEFAEVLRIHRTYVGGLERGERNPSLQVVERLAQELRVDPVELLREVGADAGADAPPALRAAAAGDPPSRSARRTSPARPSTDG
jgi:transcriptional regulator with XRE-family HTH domain